MTSTLEAGLKTWLLTEGLAVPIFTGFDGGTQPSDDQTVTVFVSECERAAGPLYRATCKFIVATPPHDANDGHAASLTNHRATVNTVRALLEDFDETSLKSTIDSETSLFFRGGFLRSGGEATIDGGRWVTALDFVAGISTDAGA